MKLKNLNSSSSSNIQDDIVSSENNTITWSSVTLKLQYGDKIIPNALTIFEPYRDYLLSLCEDVSVSSEYLYTPKSFCADYYGTPDIFWLVLWLNQIPSARHFEKSTIKVLPNASVSVLHEIINKYREKLDSNSVKPDVLKDYTLTKIVV